MEPRGRASKGTQGSQNFAVQGRSSKWSPQRKWIAPPRSIRILSEPLPLNLVAEWIHFTLFGIILPTLKLKITGAYELSD